jgi:hypothetical protein
VLRLDFLIASAVSSWRFVAPSAERYQNCSDRVIQAYRKDTAVASVMERQHCSSYEALSLSLAQL